MDPNLQMPLLSGGLSQSILSRKKFVKIQEWEKRSILNILYLCHQPKTCEKVSNISEVVAVVLFRRVLFCVSISLGIAKSTTKKHDPWIVWILDAHQSWELFKIEKSIAIVDVVHEYRRKDSTWLLLSGPLTSAWHATHTSTLVSQKWSQD